MEIVIALIGESFISWNIAVNVKLGTYPAVLEKKDKVTVYIKIA